MAEVVGSPTFTFDPLEGHATWNVEGACTCIDPPCVGCCCGGVCPYGNGVHLIWNSVTCARYWTCENQQVITPWDLTCGFVCDQYVIPNQNSVVVEGRVDCGGDPGDSETVFLDMIYFNWTPEITKVWALENPGAGQPYLVRVWATFPQSYMGGRTLGLYEVDAEGSETFVDSLCAGNLGVQAYCEAGFDPLPDTVELKVVAQACGDPTAIDEESVNFTPAPPDLGPLGVPVFSDDTSDEPNSCGEKAEAGSPVRLTNGNMRYNERLALPAAAPSLTALTYDTLNAATGVFGKGWFSAFDARLEVNTGSAAYRYRVITETNHSVFFSDAYTQTWPGTGPAGGLALVNVGGTDYYRHTNPAASLRRYYRVSDGRLGRIEMLAASTALTISYDGAGTPTAVADETGAWSWTITPDPGDPSLIGAMTAGDVGWAFAYDSGNLTGITVDGVAWRYCSYDGDDRLLEITNGQGHLIETHEYDQTTGNSVTSRTADEHITNIEYDVPESQLSRSLNTSANEYAARVTWASGTYTDYFIRPIVAAPHRVAEIRGDCSCPGGGEHTALAYDIQGRVVRKQDARGYITTWVYDSLNRVQRVERGHWPDGCDPADYPDDATVCRLGTDDLSSAVLSPLAEVSATNYTYDTQWVNKPATVCTESVVEPGQDACDAYTYDPVTGAVLTTSRSGYGWDHGTQSSEAQSRTTTRELYDGMEGAAFDPNAAALQMGVTILFDPSWVSLPQPQGLMKSVDGPRPSSDVDDTTLFVYYPEDATVLPAELRGRLAARMDPVGGVTFFDGYDAFSNVTRTIDASGVATTLQHDSLGRVTTSTLEAIPGCDTAADPLCATDLTTTYVYHGGTGPFYKVILPLGGKTRYYFDEWGRVTILRRAPGRGSGYESRVWEHLYITYDPTTSRRASESLTRPEAGVWVEHKRTDYRYDSAGRMSETEYPDTPTAAIESYAYDAVGNVVAFWNPLRYGDPNPNVKYTYDPLGRLVEVRQLQYATLLPSEDAWALTSYGYDTQSNLTTVTDANGNQTRYSVDDFGQTYEIESPVTNTTKLTYNEAGQNVFKVMDLHVTATESHTYDAAGRLEVSDYVRGAKSETVTTTYDANGRRLTADSGDLVESWAYDRRGLTIYSSREKDWMGSTVLEEASLFYSEDGVLETITYPSGRQVRYGLDNAGRPVSISATGPAGTGGFTEQISAVSYLPFGPAETVTYPLLAGGTVDSRPHDQRYRLASQNSGLPYTLKAYTYDLASNLVSVSNPAGYPYEAYTYDDMGRLRTASGYSGNISYLYDSIGNLVYRDATQGTTGLYYVNGTSPLVERVMTHPYTHDYTIHDVQHDEMGNILNDGVGRYTWDARGHMLTHRELSLDIYRKYDYTADGIMCTREGDTVDPWVSYAMQITTDSPSGQRLAETLWGAETPWRLDAAIVGGRELVWLGNRLVATFDSTASDPEYVFTDHIGYPMLVMDSSGNTLWGAAHEPYGQAILTGGTADNDPLLRYPGQWKDDPAFVTTHPPQRNLFSNGYRWYNPDWGRYTQSDPMGLEGGINLFGYGAGNPIRFIDPTGLQLVVPPPSGIPPLPGCEIYGPWLYLPGDFERDYVRTRGTWVRVGRGVPIWRPLVPAARPVGIRIPEVKPLSVPVQSGACMCIWRRRPGVFDIWRTSRLWKRENCCPPGEIKYQYHLEQSETETPGAAVFAPGEWNIRRTPGVWNAGVGCIGCPEP